MTPKLLLAGMALSAVMVAEAGSAPAPSAQQVLKGLHRSAALGARWAGFSDEAYVRVKIDTVSDGSSLLRPAGKTTEIRIEELTFQIGDEIKTAYWDADRKQLIAPGHYSLVVPDFVESRATRLPDDAVPVGTKVYAAQVYQFEKTFKVLSETRRIRWTFWLSPDVPGGELRRVTESESDDPTYAGHVTDQRLTHLDVPFVVGKKTLHAYCFDSEGVYAGGKIERGRICFNDSVPGGIVTKNIRELDTKGKETLRQDYVVIEYGGHRVKP
jgi:hypothetical protein